ncbi:putative protein XRP2 [Paratrimastix pyriformis]|uniref:C-CAP/cofactor C-like domain-containing protein n=1 Tax=Paratrimastix pyriformis TaxID=342808 RepID=A0ABQ8UW38_9EUKA|nr:putative protein XRP2 [Paratrimastix pyriformis]
MGCSQSKPRPSPAEQRAVLGGSAPGAGSTASTGAPRKKYSWEVNRPDPSNFEAKNQVGQTVIKLPGSINGQRFNIADCRDCNIYLFDRMDTVFCDGCTNCTIFLGPTSGSVFVRDSANCRIIVACQQLRTRNVTDCEFRLYCMTKPSIEASDRITFRCIDVTYPQFIDQMAGAGLQPFDNTWWDTFDFTPAPGHATCLPPAEAPLVDLAQLPAEAPKSGGQAIPVSWGPCPPPADEHILVLALAGASGEHGFAVAEQLARQGVAVLKTRYLKQPAPAALRQLLGRRQGVPSGMLSDKDLVAFDACCPRACATLQELARSTPALLDVVYTSPSLDAGAEELHVIFDA